MLTEVKTKTEHYFKDEQGMQGEYKTWYINGAILEHCLFKDSIFHGEYKRWDDDGRLAKHDFDCNDKNITDEVKALVKDILNITQEERLLIKLKWGVECLPR